MIFCGYAGKVLVGATDARKALILLDSLGGVTLGDVSGFQSMVISVARSLAF